MRRTVSSLASLLLILGAIWLWRDSLTRGASTPIEATAAVPAGERGSDLAELEASARARVDVAPPAPAAEAGRPARDPEEDAPGLFHGRLVDAETTLPLPGYRLELVAVFDRTAEWQSVRTGDDGSFELELDAGEYMILHRAEAGVGELSLAREVTPRRFEVEPAADGTLAPRTFVARHPVAALEVEVAYGDGRPAAGAVVVFSCRMEQQPLVDPGNRTNAEGRVRLGIWEAFEFTDGMLTGKDDAGNVSEPLRVDAPFVPGLRRLDLAPGGELLVRVTAEGGAPVSGRRILLSSELALGPRFYEETDPEGRFRFTELFTGEYTLSVWIPEEGRWDRRQVEIVRGEKRRLEVVLAAPEEPLAVSGRVLDEDERPLAGAQLAFAVDGRRAETVRTDEAGTFRVHAERGELVWIGANVVQQGDLFEPAELEVPFGTVDVSFERKALAEVYTFEVEVYDNATGEEVEHFVATIDRGPGTEQWSDSYAPRREFELRLLPGARWRVKSTGYVTRELDLLDELARLEEGERLRVGLDQGLDHRFQVVDYDTGEPVPGVSFRSETAGEVFSDEEGWVHLRSDHWSVYHLSKEGFQSEEWDPESALLWGRGGVYYVGRE